MLARGLLEVPSEARSPEVKSGEPARPPQSEPLSISEHGAGRAEVGIPLDQPLASSPSARDLASPAVGEGSRNPEVPATWEVEFSNATLPELRKEERRLRDEHAQEIQQEVDRRFMMGRYTFYRRDEFPPKGENHAVVATREDEAGIKAVFLDPLVDVELFQKEAKAGWLLAEIRRRERE